MSEGMSKEEELLRSIFGDDWEDAKKPPAPGGPTKDLLGRPFGEQSDAEIEAEVADAVEAKRERKRQIEQELTAAGLTEERRRELQEELDRVTWFLSQMP